MGKNPHSKHVSFSNSSTADRGGGLRLNIFFECEIKAWKFRHCWSARTSHTQRKGHDSVRSNDECNEKWC